jgi:hypothetical protein
MDPCGGERANADVCNVSVAPCFILHFFFCVILGLDLFTLLSVEEEIVAVILIINNGGSVRQFLAVIFFNPRGKLLTYFKVIVLNEPH